MYHGSLVIDGLLFCFKIFFGQNWSTNTVLTRDSSMITPYQDSKHIVLQVTFLILLLLYVLDSGSEVLGAEFICRKQSTFYCPPTDFVILCNFLLLTLSDFALPS